MHLIDFDIYILLHRKPKGHKGVVVKRGGGNRRTRGKPPTSGKYQSLLGFEPVPQRRQAGALSTTLSRPPVRKVILSTGEVIKSTKEDID